jgi:hypothetical protein
MLDPRALHQALEDELVLALRQELVDEAYERLMDVVLGYCGADPVDICACHEIHPINPAFAQH